MAQVNGACYIFDGSNIINDDAEEYVDFSSDVTKVTPLTGRASSGEALYPYGEGGFSACYKGVSLLCGNNVYNLSYIMEIILKRFSAHRVKLVYSS